MRKPEQIEGIEHRVRLDFMRKPREYRTYKRLLELRDRLRERLNIASRLTQDKGFLKSLVLEIKAEKLYELFAFTLLLHIIVEDLIDVNTAHIDREGRVLSLEGTHKQTGDEISLKIAYNAIPQDLVSRVQHAKARGILDRELDTSRLVGLPDTIILLECGSRSRRIIIDYKYTRDISYLIQARFKALAYIYEFNADYAAIIAPTPRNEVSYEDEEVLDHRGFYASTIAHRGAVIYLDEARCLAIIYIDPSREAQSCNYEVLRKFLSSCFLS